MDNNFDVVKYINEHTEGDGKCRLGYNEDFFNYLNNVDPESITDREKEALEKVVAISWVNNGIDRLPENMRVLTSLTELDLSDNQIKDISPLSGLTILTLLDLRFNQIKDISPLSELNSLTYLDLSGNQIKDISPLSELNSLTTLNLLDNQINNISPLSGLTSLTTLDLGWNHITDISPLSELNSLTYLNWSYNQITDISPLSELKSLSKLDLSGNQIKDISPLRELTSLTILALSSNQIEEIEEGTFSGLTSLTELYLFDNQIKDISPLSGLTSLTKLYLRDNQIKDISPLSGLTSLTGLYLRNNQITNISHLSGLTSLTELDLRSNQINDISPLSGLTSLTYLNLNSNQITNISHLSGLTSLTELYLSSNQIEEIEEGTFSGLTSLTTLNLLDNQIKDISHLSGLTSLTSLFLNGNQINDISPLSKLKSLTYLNLNSNQINDISLLSELTSLTYLNLSENQIKDISPLSGLTSLSKLVLQNNQINDISPLSGLTSLTKLHLGGLRLKSIPDSLIKTALDNGLEFYDDNYHEKGINLYNTTLAEQDISMFFNREALIEYYNAKEKVTINEVKVIFLGNGGAGKTHTVQRLLNDGEDVEAIKDETVGIQIGNYYTKTTADEDMTLRLWDFGGQNYMHSMHRCFLTSKTVYVVVLYGREGNLTSNAKFWLENIKSFAPNSQAIIAVNLWEGEVKPGINTEELRERYGDIYVDTAWYFARKIKEKNSSINDKHFNDLTAIIKETAEQMCQTQTSKAMAEVRKRITEEFETKSFISKVDYLNICNKVSKDLLEDDKIDETTAYVFLSYFNDTGISVSRIKKDSSGNTVGVEDDTYTVLNPNWLFTGIYRIIATQKTIKGEISDGKASISSITENINESSKSRISTRNINGEFSEMEISLPKLTDKEAYTSKQCKAILKIMRQYNMSADVGYDVEFIPAVCSDEKPKLLKCNEKRKDGTPVYKETVCLEYRYVYLPSTVIQKLMLTVKFDNICNAWQNGAEFNYGGNLVFAETDGIKNTLSLKIYKKNDDDLIYSTIEYLHETIYNINNDIGIIGRSYLVVPSKLSTDTDKKTASFSVVGLIKAAEKGDMAIPYFDNDDYEVYYLYELLDKVCTKEQRNSIQSVLREKNPEKIKELLKGILAPTHIEQIIKMLLEGNTMTTINNNTIVQGDVHNSQLSTGGNSEINVDNSQDNRKNEGPFAGGSNIGKDGSNIQVGDENKAKSNSKHTQKTDSSTHDTDITIPPQAQKKSGIFSKVADFFIRLFTSQK